MYPPENCTYEVHVTVGKRGHGVETFADEYELGAWCLDAWDPGEAEGMNGLRVFCVTAKERVEIDYRHSRLVMGRIDSRKRLAERASSNGAH